MAPDLAPLPSGEKDPSPTEARRPRSIVSLQPSSNTLVILFGWAGCQDRYLSKYSQYYEKAGYSTIRFTVPIAKVRAFSSYTHFATVFYRETLGTGLRLPDNVFIHVFSMNGCSVFTTFWDLLDQKEGGAEVKQKVKGVLFDSSPAHTSPAQSAHAISFATMPPSQYHFTLRESYRVVLFTFFSMHRGMMWLRSFLDSSIYEKNFAYFRLLNIHDLPKKQLYLYGPGDEVCSAESIDMFASEMESRGVSATRLNMKDSLHCQHYRTYPEQYTTACLAFIQQTAQTADLATGQEKETDVKTAREHEEQPAAEA